MNGKYTCRHEHTVRLAFGPGELKAQAWSFKQGDGREYYVEVTLPDGRRAVISFSVSREESERSLL